MPKPIPPTSFADIDAGLAALNAAKQRFARLSVPERLHLLEAMADGVREVKEAWVEDGCAAKGIPRDSVTAGEEWLGGPMVTQRNLRLLRESLEDVRDHGRPQLPDGAVRVASNGQTVARVFPAGFYDKLLYMGFSAEIWMEPGVTPASLPDTMAEIYQRGSQAKGKVALVLGAGNVSSIGPMDVIYKLFAENEVCILKMNPVNEYVGPHIEKAFRVLVEADFLRVVYGGAEVGQYLCQHALVETIHITGSDKTHDAIVWGAPGPVQQENKRAGTPINTKPITSELGNVSPVIIVPGPWTDADLAFQAANIASQVANNGSFNCNAAKCIVQHAGWDRRNALMDQVEATLRAAPRRKAYYPGADHRYDGFLAAHPEAKALGERRDGVIPWTTIRNVPSTDRDNICFNTEAFCGVLAETTIEAADPIDFLRKAVVFCNDTMWGTLNVSLIVHPSQEKDPAFRAALEQAIADLRYGTVGVNHWPALGYAFCTTTWGAYPGHPLDDIRSGRGVVHNTYLFGKPQKSVVRGPFRVNPKPPWFVTNKNTHNIAPRATEFERAPSVFKLPGLMFAAMKG